MGLHVLVHQNGADMLVWGEVNCLYRWSPVKFFFHTLNSLGAALTGAWLSSLEERTREFSSPLCDIVHSGKTDNSLYLSDPEEG